ncbi:VanZ family protein [Thioalkalivibrio sp. ALJT]|uniref:VanZ family protein n=1 Tax=Thioalkalivibrio sp. ALJT TaxID=1158146 RepID=UPI0003775D8F|nr:VanZ family protein [Thioalkalivibrio sp. ALJT]
MSLAPSGVRVPWSRGACGGGALVALAIALYVTLLPFQFDDTGLAQAWETYRSMTLTAPGIGARQQFVSNVLLFLPLGFFLAAWIGFAATRFRTVLLSVLVAAVLGLMVTASVEFLQVWLPYRYPAGADILGNFTGALLGAIGWFVLRERLALALHALGQGGVRALQRVLPAYFGVYLIVGLLPFDLVLSVDELRTRLASDAWGWWTAGGACVGGFECQALLFAMVLLSLPVGLMVGLWARGRGHSPWLALMLVVLLAALVEAANLLTWSGTAEGRSALVRALGMMGGLALARVLPIHPQRLLRTLQWVRLPVLLVMVPLYVVALAGVNHGFGPYGLDFDAASERLAGLRLWPFFYHYQVAEAAALRSVVLHLAMYAPLGVLLWLAWVPHGRRWQALLARAALSGLVVALVVEAGKLLVVDGARPDTTTLLLAALAASGTAGVLVWLRWALTVAPGDAPRTPEPEPSSAVASADRGGVWRPGWRQILFLTPGLWALWLAAGWPVGAAPLVTGLLAYAALLAWRPQAWLLVVPVAIPLLDLSLYTGPLRVSVLDLVLLVTVAVVLARGSGWRQPAALSPGVRWAWRLLLVSTAVALVMAWGPWPYLGPIAVAPYLTDWDALRVARGVFWAAVLLWLLQWGPESPRAAVRRWFVPGVALGLVAALLVVLRERVVYPGLLDFDSRYRISGWFGEMQVGGPTIETFLVLALPLALAWCWTRRSWLAWIAGGLLFVGGVYAVAMTYSRGGYAGLAVALVLLLVGLVAAWRGRRSFPGPAALAAGVALALSAAALPAMLSGFAEQRLAQVGQGLEARMDHWHLALDLPGGHAVHSLLGRGLGEFARAYRDAHAEAGLPANFAFGDGRLRLGPGDSYYINQRVAPARTAPHALEVRVRAAAGGRLGVYLCEKPVRHSFQCVSGSVSVDPGDGWQEGITALDLSEMDGRPWPLRRGLVLSIDHAGGDTVIEVDAVRLTAPDGRDVLRNGDFESGARHWYFTTDHLWPWRVENQWLEVYFEQGLLGLVAFAWLTLAAGWVLLLRALRGDWLALGSLAAVSGVLVVGVFGTVLFSPSVALLFYLVLLLGLIGSSPVRTADPSRVRQAPGETLIESSVRVGAPRFLETNGLRQGASYSG